LKNLFCRKSLCHKSLRQAWAAAFAVKSYGTTLCD
jgi:hypothetical protein